PPGWSTKHAIYILHGVKLSASHRLPELDVLRGVAILLVLGRHIYDIPPEASPWTAAIFRAWRNFGWIGVDLFFVLSGFLIGGLIFAEAIRYGTIQPVRFLIRRGLKIYPAFYAFLFLSLLLCNRLHIPIPDYPRGLYGEIFFLQNYFDRLWPQTW